MRREATYLCMGVLQGLYAFKHESQSEFKNWATDLPLGHAELVVEQWCKGGMTAPAIKQLHNFILDQLPRWAYAFNRTLTRHKG